MPPSTVSGSREPDASSRRRLFQRHVALKAGRALCGDTVPVLFRDIIPARGHRPGVLPGSNLLPVGATYMSPFLFCVVASRGGFQPPSAVSVPRGTEDRAA